MRLSQAKLAKYRSGQTAWKVIINVSFIGHDANKHLYFEKGPNVLHLKNAEGEIYVVRVQVFRRFFCGKKRKAPDTAGALAGLQFMQAKSQAFTGDPFFLGVYRPDYVWFVSDVGHGAATFSSQRQADRFAADVIAGRYPDLVKRELDFAGRELDFAGIVGPSILLLRD